MDELIMTTAPTAEPTAAPRVMGVYYDWPLLLSQICCGVFYECLLVIWLATIFFKALHSHALTGN